MKYEDYSVSGWDIDIDEISANILKISASNDLGNCFEKVGENLEDLVRQCDDFIKSVEKKSDPNLSE